MAFGRRKKDVEDAAGAEAVEAQDGFVDDLDAEDRAAEDAELLAALDRDEREQQAQALARPQGPWDAADAPPLDPPRVDLGGLLVPVLPDTDVRLEVSPEGEVVAATLVHGESALQINAFAAPRTEGIWVEVRTEIRDALNSSGGKAEEAEGPLGRELRASVPTDVPGQGIVLAPARFVGVDGPRWFLRGLVTGPAAQDDAAVAPLIAALQQVAVVRGSDPMAVRDPLPLVLPAEAVHVDEPAEEPRGGLQMPARGPEITEIR